MKHEHMFFDLFIKLYKEEEEDIHTKFMDLLNEFQDIVYDNIPYGFILIKNISDQMDLIPRANLSNKEIHRMTFEKSGELKKHIQELLHNCLI